MFQRDPWSEFIGGGRGRPPRFVVALMVGLAVGVVAGSFAELERYAGVLRLTPAVWEDGQLWRLVTYGLVGSGTLSVWSVLQLILVYWFVVEVCVLVGVARARVTMLGGVAVAGAAAAMAQFASDAVGGPRCSVPFWMMQGQHIVLAIALPAFAVANRHSVVSHTPYLLGLPIPARWLIPLQMLGAVAAYASTRDLGGFVGVCAATIWGMRMGRPTD